MITQFKIFLMKVFKKEKCWKQINRFLFSTDLTGFKNL